MFCFVISILNVISFVEPENKLNFNVNEGFDDLLVEDNLIQSMYTESLSECAMICAMEENCFSFSYKEDATECRGYNVTKWYSLPGSATISQGWKHYSAKEADITFYLGMDPTLSWENATIACENSGMRLAVLPTPMLMTAAVDFLREQSFSGGSWIGLRKNETVNTTLTYSWIDGTEGMNLRWYGSEEPDNTDVQLCIKIHKGSWLLRTAKCWIPRNYLCI